MWTIQKRFLIFHIQGEGRVDTSGHFFIVSNYKNFLRTIHPCTLTPTLTKTRQITSIPCTSGPVSQLFVSYFACQWMRSVDSPSPSPLLNCFELAEHSKADPTIDASHGANRKIATSRRLDLDVICFGDEKVFKVDAAVQITGFHTFSR